VARRRAQWKKYQARVDPTRLVFIDETWAKTNMTRTHGRAPRGTRLVAKAPHGRWRTLTFLAALRHDSINAPCVIDGPINGHSFLAYVEQFLVPTLKPNAGQLKEMVDVVRCDTEPSAECRRPRCDLAIPVDGPMGRRILVQGQMRLEFGVIGRVGGKDSTQMGAEDDDVIKAFPADRPYQPLRMPVLPR
jgi:hypothetical protein